MNRCHYCHKQSDKSLEIQHPWKEIECIIHVCSQCMTAKLKKLDKLESYYILFFSLVRELKEVIEGVK